MELSDLRVFLRVLDSGSLSSAARTIGLPKSSVSRALTRLESDVGAVLLDRSGRRVKMTDAGLALQPHAALLLAAAEEAQASVDSASGLLRGRLKVNVPFALAAILLAPMLADFLKRYPDLDLVLDVDNRRIDLAAEEVDVALRIGPLPSSELVAQYKLSCCARNSERAFRVDEPSAPVANQSAGALGIHISHRGCDRDQRDSSNDHTGRRGDVAGARRWMRHRSAAGLSCSARRHGRIPGPPVRGLRNRSC
jgi:DNA-binding transcriptional LysR family regulator